MKDLVVVVPDSNTEQTLYGLLSATRHCKFDASSTGYLFILNATRVSYSEVHPYSPRSTL
jgi:hypothetical protein